MVQWKRINDHLKPYMIVSVTHYSVQNRPSQHVILIIRQSQWKKNDNDNKENCATDEDSACTMTLTMPNAIGKVVIFKNGKRYCLEI